MKIFKFFRNTYKTEKETPVVGVEPDTSHLLDEHPRPLDHFCMFLIKSQLVTLNTTLRLHNNDN